MIPLFGMVVSFGQMDRERIEIDVLGYERAPVGEFYDDNWLTVTVKVSAGGFRGNIGAAILTSELKKFSDELHPLFQKLNGAAEFVTLEEQLRLKLEGDGKGHIRLEGDVHDRAGIGNRLSFSLQFDQTSLGASIRELEAVLTKFPVRST